MGVWTELVHRHSGRVRSAVSVSGPQRCTMAFQQQTQELARRLNRPVLTSVLETRIQAMTAHKFYGRSMIVHMDQIGVLNAQTVLIHGVWQTSSDLDILVAPSTHKSPFDACRLGCGICDSIRRIDKPRLQFIELRNAKEAKSFKWAASSDRLVAARRRGFQITRTSH